MSKPAKGYLYEAQEKYYYTTYPGRAFGIEISFEEYAAKQLQGLEVLAEPEWGSIDTSAVYIPGKYATTTDTSYTTTPNTSWSSGGYFTYIPAK